MPAGAVTPDNTATVWTDFTKLSPIVWLDEVRLQMEIIQPALDLYDYDKLDQFNKDYSGVASGGFGNVMDEGEDYTVTTHNQEDNMSVSVRQRGAAYQITERLLLGNKYSDVESGMRDTGRRLVKTRGRDAMQHAFTFGFSSSFTDAEGNTVTNGIANQSTEAIFANTHTMATGETYDNLGATDALGETTLKTLTDLTPDFIDEDGFPVTWGTGAKTLLVSDDVPIVFTARRLTTQEFEIDSAERNINLFPDLYKMMSNAFLDTLASGKKDSAKDKYYFILDRQILNEKAKFSDFLQPTLSGPFEDNQNGGMLWRSKTLYDIGVHVAHIGAGAPATS